MKNYYDFTGKTAIVTGAGSKRGFGIATSLMFAGYGANVVVVDIDGEGAEFNAKRVMEENPGVKAISVKADLTSEADVKALVKTTMDTFGPILFDALSGAAFDCASLSARPYAAPGGGCPPQQNRRADAKPYHRFAGDPASPGGRSQPKRPGLFSQSLCPGAVPGIDLSHRTGSDNCGRY